MGDRASNKQSLSDLCRMVIGELLQYKNTDDDAHFSYELASFDERAFLKAVNGCFRVAFKSRDRDFAFYGIGSADLIMTAKSGGEDALVQVVNKLKTLRGDQFYFGAMRFDGCGEMSSEWQRFGQKIFILPLIMIIIRAGQARLGLNYRHDGPLPWSVWLDQAISFLRAIGDDQAVVANLSPQIFHDHFTPTEPRYSENIDLALSILSDADSSPNKKVVIGRRRSIKIEDSIDAVDLFFRLQENSQGSFLFLLDDYGKSTFFGGSPELLYRRTHLSLESESLAGTRPRASDERDDNLYRDALFKSLKDNREHALVSSYIEQKLKEIGVSDLSSSKLEVMALSYVQHLVKRYRGVINGEINDADILKTLHPTPAVCGLSIEWAFDFIRRHEGFDRGFYAGPIGYLGRDEAEFAVAIRSALYYEGSLFIYAASGIVAGSDPKQEWEELNNKEKNILSIFNG